MVAITFIFLFSWPDSFACWHDRIHIKTSNSNGHIILKRIMILLFDFLVLLRRNNYQKYNRVATNIGPEIADFEKSF
jgi:hypothetical protein